MNYQITCVCGHRFFITEKQLPGHVTCPGCGRALIPVVTPNPAPPASAADPSLNPGTAADPATAGSTAPPPDSIATSAEATKRCPYCGEVILAIARKCKHCGEFLDREIAPAGNVLGNAAGRNAASPAGSPAQGRAPTGAPTIAAKIAAADDPPLFALSVSQWDNFWKYLICLTIAVLVPAGLIKIPALHQFAQLGVPITVVAMAMVAWFFFMSTRNAKCFIRPTRIETEVGLLSKDLNSLQLFRITDIEFKQGIIARMLGIGTLRITANDPNIPELVLYQIPQARQVYKYLQQQVPIAARQNGAIYMER